MSNLLSDLLLAKPGISEIEINYDEDDEEKGGRRLKLTWKGKAEGAVVTITGSIAGAFYLICSTFVAVLFMVVLIANVGQIGGAEVFVILVGIIIVIGILMFVFDTVKQRPSQLLLTEKEILFHKGSLPISAFGKPIDLHRQVTQSELRDGNVSGVSPEYKIPIERITQFEMTLRNGRNVISFPLEAGQRLYIGEELSNEEIEWLGRILRIWKACDG